MTGEGKSANGLCVSSRTSQVPHSAVCDPISPQRRCTRLWLCRTVQGACSPHEAFSKLPRFGQWLWCLSRSAGPRDYSDKPIMSSHGNQGAPTPCCSLCSQISPSGTLHVARGVLLPGLSVYVVSLFLGVMCSAVPTPWGRKPPLPSWRRGGDQSRLLGSRPQLRGPFGRNEQRRGPPCPLGSTP